MPPIYRPMTLADIPHLAAIDAEFTADRYLAIEKIATGLNVTWRLSEQPLEPPFCSTAYSLDHAQCQEVASRLRAGDGLYLVVEIDHQVMALLDMEREQWRNTAMIWNLMIDRRYRQQGIGRALIHRAIDWARRTALRAIVLETQTNNYPACRFYQKMGFKLCGLDDHFYSNADIAIKEVAIFWWYELEQPA